MKNLNVYVMTAVLLLSLQSIAQHPYPMKKKAADSAWNRLTSHNESDKGFISKQARLLKYREDGLKFWKMFPNDYRRYQWLQQTVGHGKWLDYLEVNDADSAALREKGLRDYTAYTWPLNKKALGRWEEEYPKIRKEFLTYYYKDLKLNAQDKESSKNVLELLSNEISSFLNLSLNKEYRKGSKIDLNKLLNLLKTASSFSTNANRERIYSPMGHSFISCYNEYGLNFNDMINFFNSVKDDVNPVLKNWAIQQGNLFELMKKPLVLKYKSLDGGVVDLDMLRGKVVLVDFWSTGCSDCIARMPIIKRIYDKYKSKKFEVVSVCFADDNELDKIKKIEDKIGTDWPTLLIGSVSTKNSLGQQIFEKYGFYGVPQLLLLDKGGKLVMINDRLRYGDFEPDVKRLLAKTYPSK